MRIQADVGTIDILGIFNTLVCFNVYNTRYCGFLFSVFIF
ncbi:hypothetical protein HMF8227_01659 [Saliniradius amylolyticus]|uniref:Uncharacterized protein n=1 Tax=Saliniradius amylolyticus TaxID=2183582 RepID=A0A2S2E3P2_9ALTE|nr:hypothetical protein HMF8227_01659 [Saliniradius amylolyticus]